LGWKGGRAAQGVDNQVPDQYIYFMDHAPYHQVPSGDHSSPVPLGALNRPDIRPGSVAGVREKTGSDTEEKRSYLVCKICGNTITSEAEGIEINGSHEHTFMNPGGFVFRIGCFFDAAGCAILGVPTVDYTWFPGFSWSCVICSTCLTHLGWHYRSEGKGFFGLILDQLVRR
jgi:hypothetical protein